MYSIFRELNPEQPDHLVVGDLLYEPTRGAGHLLVILDLDYRSLWVRPACHPQDIIPVKINRQVVVEMLKSEDMFLYDSDVHHPCERCVTNWQTIEYTIRRNQK